ncbi:MAG: dihydropteroate synthase [Alphaproteobacteria bacterium]|nr:dihydropteroate synthase [Alphaproteobacteria bacterium]
MNNSKGAFADQREPLFDLDPTKPTQAIEPLGLVSGRSALDLCESGGGFALAGGPIAFTHGRIGDDILTAGEMRNWAIKSSTSGDASPARRIEALTSPRADFAELALSGAGSGPRIMGVCNVTLDSFSDGGDHDAPDAAIAFAHELITAGADMIDVGGESTRPGADPISHEAELARVLPVVEALAGAGVCVSIDTRHATVMREAIAVGATIVNDVMALTGPGALEAVAQSHASIVLMHMQGMPQTMQDFPAYQDVTADVFAWLTTRVWACVEAGISMDRIAIDPGFGFGKTIDHNVRLLAQLGVFHGLGCAVAVGLSRKSFIGALTGEDDPASRVAGSVAAALVAVGQGAQIVRVHDVAETRAAFTIWQAQTGVIG